VTPRVRLALTVLVSCTCLFAAAIAWAGEGLIVHASFTPDQPGAATNLSLAAGFASSAEIPPSPITKFVLYAPAGLEVDTHGTGTCAAATLETKGPSGCPEDSRAGFGGGVGVLELANETVHEPYTLDFFFASTQRGHLRLLIYAEAIAPASVQLVLVARQISVPRPYGLGFSVEVPPVATVPGAANASVESAFVTIGGADVAYYESVKGKRTLVHLQGLVVPRHCPAGGFPAQGIVDFQDGTTVTANTAIPCPRG
jgi:hypothetical protein